jgi:hypothetical protein
VRRRLETLQIEEFKNGEERIRTSGYIAASSDFKSGKTNLKSFDIRYF